MRELTISEVTFSYVPDVGCGLFDFIVDSAPAYYIGI